MSEDFIWGSDTNLKRIIKEIAWDTEPSNREDKESYWNECSGSWGACKQLAHGLPTDHSSRSSSPPATAQTTFTAPATRFKESLRETDDFPTLAFNRDSMSGRMKWMKSPCCSQLDSTPCVSLSFLQASPLVALGSSHGDKSTSGHPMPGAGPSRRVLLKSVLGARGGGTCGHPPLTSLFYLHCVFSS